MNARPCSTLVLWTSAFLLFTGCEDSKNPLSDPLDSKPDARLAGVWRLRGEKEGEVSYYHVGPLGEGLPAGVMCVVAVTHAKDGQLKPPGQLLIFPTTLGSNTYLNLTGGDEQHLKAIKEEGWKSVESYLLLRYRIEGDHLLVQLMDGDAKKAAIQAKKIKGTLEKRDSGERAVLLTDTTENLARFVAAAGDSLFSKKPLRLERVR